MLLTEKPRVVFKLLMRMGKSCFFNSESDVCGLDLIEMGQKKLISRGIIKNTLCIYCFHFGNTRGFFDKSLIEFVFT